MEKIQKKTNSLLDAVNKQKKTKVLGPRDQGFVIEGLGVDVNNLLETNMVPDTQTDVFYNELSDVESVGVRINDDFEAMMVMRKYKDDFESSDDVKEEIKSKIRGKIGFSKS